MEVLGENQEDINSNQIEIKSKSNQSKIINQEHVYLSACRGIGRYLLCFYPINYKIEICFIMLYNGAMYCFVKHFKAQLRDNWNSNQ